MIKVLNLYAGIGGNRKLWPGYICLCGYSFEYGLGKYGCPNCEGDNTAKLVEITAVEINPEIAKIYQNFFPDDTVIVGDAHQYLLDHYKEFDFIWSSPPCPSHSEIRRCATYRGQQPAIYPDMSLYQEIILLQFYAPKDQKWVIENVDPYYEPLIQPSKKSHRHFYWANFRIDDFNVADSRTHLGIKSGKDTVYGFNISDYKTEKRKDTILRNMVDPELGLHIFNAALERIDKTKIKQTTLFD